MGLLDAARKGGNLGKLSAGESSLRRKSERLPVVEQGAKLSNSEGPVQQLTNRSHLLDTYVDGVSSPSLQPKSLFTRYDDSQAAGELDNPKESPAIPVGDENRHKILRDKVKQYDSLDAKYRRLKKEMERWNYEWESAEAYHRDQLRAQEQLIHQYQSEANEAKAQIQSLQNANRDTETELKQHTSVMESLKSSHREDIVELELRHNESLRNAHAKEEYLQHEIMLLKRDQDQVILEQRAQHDIALGDLKDHSADDMARVGAEWEDKVKRLEVLMDKQRSEHECALEDQKEVYRRSLEDLEVSHENVLKEQEARNSHLLDDQRAVYRRDLEAQESHLANELSKQQENMDAAMGQTKTRFTKQLNKLEQTIAILKTSSKEEIAKERAQHDAVVRKLKEDHETVVKELNENISKMYTMVLAKEQFTAVPERILKEKFSTLATEVQILARTEWRLDQQVWPKEVLGRVSTNLSSVTEHLLRDAIWRILHDRVFCSPFRVFGNEGEVSEKQWNTAYGKDDDLKWGEYTWPKPSMEAERFRYETVEGYKTVLMQPLSHIDPRMKMKLQFKESRQQLIQMLASKVGEVATVDASVTTSIDKIIKNAISMWLEFGTQRCRLMIDMPTPRVVWNTERMALTESKEFVLTGLPGVLRYGDDRGLSLNERKYVAGCKPDTASLAVS